MNIPKTHSAVPEQPDAGGPSMVRAPDPLADEASALLHGPLADDWVEAGDATAARSRRLLGERLAERTARSARRSHAMVTVRHGRAPADTLAPGVTAREVYRGSGAAPRRGEPMRVRLIELAPGTAWLPEAAGAGLQRDWLVVRGTAELGGAVHGPRDYRIEPAGFVGGPVRSDTGALLYLREAPQPQGQGLGAHSVFDAQAGWQDYAPLIKRRVLWQHGDEAALLYLAEAGAAVPLHDHGHDEECLMVQGDLYIDDLLLREGDYQLAPAGTAHEILSTDTGAVLYAHGDAALAFR